MTEVTDGPKPSWPESAASLAHTADWYGAPDTRLQWMADFADSLDVGIGITLVVPGGTISGAVISGQEFFKRTAEMFREQACPDDNPDSIGEQLAKSFFDFAAEQMDQNVKEMSEAFDKGERDEPRWPMVRQIHLQDARFSVPGQNHISLGYTRVLLSQVIAWSCGQRWVGEL